MSQLTLTCGGGSNGQSVATLLVDLLTMPAETDRDVTLEYVDATHRTIWTPIQHEYWLRWYMEYLAATGGWCHSQVLLYSVVQPVAYTDAGITYSAGWDVYNNGTCLNGIGAKKCETAAKTATFSVTGTERLYLVITKISNGGYASVTIDGGTDLVNELPLVSGYRQLNFYAAADTTNQRILVATGLNSASTYTVVITSTGTKQDESSGVRVYLEGYGTRCLSINNAAVLAANACKSLAWSLGGQTNEYAYSYSPTSVSPLSYHWSGQGHLNETITSVAWEDQDGNDISVSAVDTHNNAAQVLCIQSGTTQHPDAGGDHATWTMTHTYNTAGMNVYHAHTWLSECMADVAYPAMWNFAGSRSPLGYVGDYAGGAALDLTDDDDSYKGMLQNQLIMGWASSVPYVPWLYIPDISSVGNWANSAPFNARIWDQAGGTINKGYFARAGGGGGAPTPIAINDVWESLTYYRVSYYADVANLP